MSNLSLEDLYEVASNTYGNIHDHLPTLKKYSEECEHITEMGVDKVVSTYGFLMGKPKTMVSYDINPIENFGVDRNDLKELAKKNGIDFTFIVADTTKININETDLLFIDTEHNYLQLKKELELHSDKVKKYLIFHDTVTYGYSDSNYYNYDIDLGISEKKGLMPAIEEFLNDNTCWVIHERFENCNGLLILKKIQ